MKLTVTHQERYSRGQLLLRTVLGWLYIGIPHGFLLAFVAIWSGVLTFITFWAALFTGRFPKGIFEWQVGFQNWYLRVSASLSNLVDGYPAFAVKGTSDKVKLEVPYPERVNRGLVVLRALLGVFYVWIPHGICLFGRGIATAVLEFLAWWVVLFTGNYPERWHAFNVGTLRWSTRAGLYMGFMTDTYPRFSGQE
jgi:hypothetical protein